MQDPPARGGELLALLEAASDHGLQPHHLGLGNLKPKPSLAAVEPTLTTTIGRAQIAESTRKLLQVLQAGAVPGSDQQWHIADSRPLATTATAGFEGRVRAAQPAHPQYNKLKAALIRHRDIAANGEWPNLGQEVPQLRPGQRHPKVAALRGRLRASGDLSTPMQADPYYFDAVLAKALRAFQQRHGLLSDGVLDKATVRELNVSAGKRVQQLQVSLERWRWMPQHLGTHHLWVNIAGGYLQLVIANETALEMPAIAGRPYRPTPSLGETLRRIDFNPGWNVPQRVAIEDLLPLQQQNSGFLSSKKFKVYQGYGKGKKEISPESINWQTLNRRNFPYWLHQLPGPANSMGRVKFFLNNPYDIFLHDSPGKGLFQLPGRTFSSGCVRLSQPRRLAQILLDHFSSANENVDAIVERGNTVTRRLDKGINSYLVYMTSWVDDHQRVHFRRDVYGRDAVVYEQLYNSL